MDFLSAARDGRGVDPKSPDHLAFGRAIRELRDERGISQEELSHRSGLDRSYMGGVERGERNISLENICLIAKALDVPPAELFQGWESRRVGRSR